MHKESREKNRRIVDRSQRIILTQYAQKLSELSGSQPHKTVMIQRALKQVLGRSGATSRETSLIIHLLRKAILAIERKEKNTLFSEKRG